MPQPQISSVVAAANNAESTAFVLGQPNTTHVYLTDFDQDAKADVIVEPLDARSWSPSKFKDLPVQVVSGGQRITLSCTPSGVAGSADLRVVVVGSALVPQPKITTVTCG